MISENEVHHGLKEIRQALDGTNLEIKSAIMQASVLIRLTLGGNPRQPDTFSKAEQIIRLLNQLNSDHTVAVAQCRDLCKELFGLGSENSDLKTQMRLLIDLALKIDKPAAGPFG